MWRQLGKAKVNNLVSKVMLQISKFKSYFTLYFIDESSNTTIEQSTKVYISFHLVLQNLFESYGWFDTEIFSIAALNS